MQRLDQVFVGAGFDSRDFILCAVARRDNQHRDEVRPAHGFDLPAALQCAHIAQIAVDDDQIGPALTQEVERHHG